MAITAINIIKDGPAPWAGEPQDVAIYAEIKQALTAAVYLSVSALTLVSSPDGRHAR